MTSPRPAMLRRVPWWLWTLIAVGAIVGAVAAIGGFADVPITRVPTIALGSVYRGDQVQARVLSVSLADTAPGDRFTPDTGKRYLKVAVRSTNTGKAPISASSISLRVILAGAVDVGDVADLAVLARNGQTLASLEPGVPTTVDFLWEVPGDTDPRARLVIGMLESSDGSGSDATPTGPHAVARLETRIGAIG